MAQMIGKWEEVSKHNFEALMDARDMTDAAKREATLKFKFGFEVSQAGPQWTFTLTGPGGPNYLTFASGKPFEVTRDDGFKIQITTVIEGDNKSIETINDPRTPGLNRVITREVTGNELTVTTILKDTGSVTVSKFKRAA